MPLNRHSQRFLLPSYKEINVYSEEMCRITFTLHVHDLTFHVERWRWWSYERRGWQASDGSSRRRLVSFLHDTIKCFSERLQDNFQLCLWCQKADIFRGRSGNLQPCWWVFFTQICIICVFVGTKTDHLGKKSGIHLFWMEFRASAAVVVATENRYFGGNTERC